MKTSPIIVNEIRRLSQEEGLKDTEIAEIIQYNRISIQRIRQEFGIPTYNKMMRKDKRVVCPQCKKEYFIRRCEKDNKICCPECEKKININIDSEYCS